MEMERKSNLLLEVGCEELPPRFIPAALEQLQEGLAAQMKEQHLGFRRCKAWGTPRRLVLLVEDLASRQPHRQQNNKKNLGGRRADALSGQHLAVPGTHHQPHSTN